MSRTSKAVPTAKPTSLWDQVKDLELHGARLSGDAEVLHEIEDYFRRVEPYLICRDQIRKILEAVPSIFAEDWQSPYDYKGLNPKQWEVYRQLYEIGGQIGVIEGPVIQKVIELALEFKQKAKPGHSAFLPA